MVNLHRSSAMKMEKSVDGYLTHSNLHLFSPLEMGKLKPGGYFSSSKIERREGRPCGGKRYFEYHPNAVFNPYTGEVRMPDHTKKLTSETVTLKKETESVMIDLTPIPSDYILNTEEEVYKENRLYDINKIYESLKELIEKLSLYKVTKSKSEKSTTKKKPKKKSSDKEGVEKQSEMNELNSNDKEIALLWNLWLLLILTNPHIDRKFEFLRDILFMSNNP